MTRTPGAHVLWFRIFDAVPSGDDVLVYFPLFRGSVLDSQWGQALATSNISEMPRISGLKINSRTRSDVRNRSDRMPRDHFVTRT